MFSKEDKANRNTYMKAVRDEASLIRDRLMGLHKLMNDDTFIELHELYHTPIQINIPNLLELEDIVKFILSDRWEKEYNELFDALDQSGVEYSIDSDTEELISFIIILKPSDYHLLVELCTYKDGIDIFSYYTNTDVELECIDNSFPENKDDNVSWKEIVSIWISELKRIESEGWELYGKGER
jgi:hypothetical protein